MKKSIVCFIVLLCLLLPVGADMAAELLVMDYADLLTPEEEEALDAGLAQISGEIGADIVILTVDTLEGYSAQAYADDFYDYNGYGQGADYDGALFLIAMEEREWAISTSGYGITVIHEGALDYMEEYLVPYLSDGAYYEAFSLFGEICREYWLTEPGETPYGYYGDPYYDEYY